MPRMDSPAGASAYLATDRQTNARAGAEAAPPTGALPSLTEALGSFYEAWPGYRSRLVIWVEDRWLGVGLAIAFLIGGVLGLLTAEWGFIPR